MARRKFKFVVSMQRYSKFNKEEHENAEFLSRAYPDLQTAYLEEEPPRKEGDDPRIFSAQALIDGHSEFIPDTAPADTNSALNSLVTPFSEMGSQTIKTMLSFSTVAIAHRCQPGQLP